MVILIDWLQSEYIKFRRFNIIFAVLFLLWVNLVSVIVNILHSGFTVRLLGNSIKLAQLETQTMMLLDPFPPITNNTTLPFRNESDTSKATKCQYEPVFMQLADENK